MNNYSFNFPINTLPTIASSDGTLTTLTYPQIRGIVNWYERKCTIEDIEVYLESNYTNFEKVSIEELANEIVSTKEQSEDIFLAEYNLITQIVNRIIEEDYPEVQIAGDDFE